MPNPPSPPTVSAAPHDLIVRGKRVITPEGERAAAVHIRGGAIVAITAFDDVPAGIPVHEAGGAVVMPGIVDTHVHINEPGRTEWEGFSTATRAAAAGGVTTLIEMPLNSIPATTTAAAFREKLAAAAGLPAVAGKLSVDTGFWGGVVPGNVAELKPLWDAGVFGFKCFLVPSGVDEFASVNETDLRAAFPQLAAHGRAVARSRRAARPNRRCDCEVAKKRIAETLRDVARIPPARSRGRSDRASAPARA